MKVTENIKEETYVEKLSNMREQIGIEIQDLSIDQLKKYVTERLTIHPKEVWPLDNKR